MIRLRHGGHLSDLRLRIEAHDLPRTETANGQPGGPALPRKGAYWQLTLHGRRPAMVQSRTAEAFVATLREAALQLGLGLGPLVRTPSARKKLAAGSAPCAITSGLWTIHVHVTTPRRTEMPSGEVVPLIDSDACLTPVRDALQCAGVLDDDARIVSDSTSRGLAPHSVEILLRPVEAARAQQVLPGLAASDIIGP